MWRVSVLEADWIGRLVWTDCYDLDETHFYIENGNRLSTLEVLHRNFHRFLDWHRLRYSDLMLTTPSGKQPLTHPTQLVSPGDFARIVHREGKRVRVDVLLDDLPRRVEHRSLPVGKAFMLADFTRTLDNTVELIDGYYGERLNDRVMPYWFGVKEYVRSQHPNPHQVKRVECHEIVIVGAGLAGLTAAAQLEKAGRHPVIYEANPNRIGGRLHSLALKRGTSQCHLDEFPFGPGNPLLAVTKQGESLGVIEAGGEFIGAHHLAVRALAQELGLDLVKVDPPLQQPDILVSPSSGVVQTLNEFASQHGSLLDRICSVWHRWRHHGLCPRLTALPIDRFFDRMNELVPFRNVICGSIRGQFGAEMDQVSLDDWFEMQPFDQTDRLTLFALDEFSYRMRGGLQQLPIALEQRLTQLVQTGHTLTELRSAEGKQYVLDFQDPQRERLRVFADYVILTIPVAPFRRHVGFDVPIDISLALNQVSSQPMGHNIKTIAWFGKPFWRSRVPNAFFYLSTSDFTLWEVTMTSSDSTLYPLVVYTGGTQANPAPEPAALIERVLTHLEPAFPSIRQDFITVSQPVEWSTNPYAQGSYTGIGAERNDFQDLYSLHGPLCYSRLTLAGEALSLEFRGFAEGAVETGLKAADRILASLTSVATTTSISA